MNFIIFMPDELRAESMGCYGHPLDVTPNLDAFAAQGTRFDQCHVQHTVCSPSRCSMLTGWYPHVRGHRTLWHLLRPDEPNLFRYLREAGYDVHWFGKNDALSPESFASSVNEAGSKGRGYPFGPSPWSPEDPQYYSFLHEPWADSLDHHSDQANVQAAIDLLRNRSGTTDRPFVLYLPLLYPHCPYSAPEPWHSRFQPEQVADGLRPANLPGKPSFHSGMRELRRLDQCPEDLFAKVNAVYLGMTAFNDHLFGRLMDELESSPFREDTTVLYLSDHGDYAGDYGLVEKWPSAAEDVITRVPLIIRTPGGREGHVVAEQVELFDIMPTILGLAGVEAGHTHFARDLTPQLHGRPGDPDRMVFTEGGYDPHEPHCFEGRNEDWGELHPYWPKLTLQQRDAGTIGRTATVRTSTHKLTRRNGDISELYDLVRDPLETVNLIDQPEYQGIQRELELVLLDWYMTTSDVTPFDENPRGHKFRNRVMTAPALATRRTDRACFDPGTARQLDGFRDRLRHVRIALCDMDDTLLDGRKRFPHRTEQAVRRWLDAGYELVLATGRPPRRAREVSEWLNLRPMICYNGCWIEHRRHVQYRRQMSRETTQAVIRCLLDACPDLWMGIESHDVLYAAQPQDRWPHAILCDPVDLDIEAAKIFCRFSHLTEAQLQAVRLTAPPGTRLMESAKYNLLQFMDQAADKAVAAAWWLAQSGMDMGNCIALGDDTNDVRLLSEAAIGIAMSDAVPDAVTASDITVRNSESEGVAIALTTILELAGPARCPTAG